MIRKHTALTPLKKKTNGCSLDEPPSSSLKGLTEVIFDLVQQMKHLTQKLDTQPLPVGVCPHSKESRFQTVMLEMPNLDNKDSLKQNLEEWIGDVFRTVFSIGFNHFNSGQFNSKKTKIFCSESILLNIINVIKMYDLSEVQVKIINDCIKDTILPYLLLKYPQSEEAEVNLSLAKQVGSTDNFNNNQNDLIFKSGVKFELTNNGQYNTPIIKFLNYIINLPNIELPVSYEQDNLSTASIWNLFYNDMDNLFKSVESEKNVQQMQQFDPKNPTREGRLLDRWFSELFQGENRQNRQQEDDEQTKNNKKQYAEKVRTYTQYLIGRKLTENFQPYSNKQIDEGDLKIPNSSLMRILTKWSQQLEENFESEEKIINRQEQFRMKDGTQKFISKSYLIILAKLLQLEKKNVINYLEEIMNNNYEHQTYFSKKQCPKTLKSLSIHEAKMGLFSIVNFKNNKNYLIGYLNVLIHCLLKAMTNFQAIIQAIKSSKRVSEDMLGAMSHFLHENKLDIQKMIGPFLKNKVQIGKKYDHMIPQLITFKIGDLLRCKCSSKQTEIKALYNEFERLSYQKPEFLKIVRVKNRLQKGTKDILLNIMYRKTMVIQVQLGINSDRSRFIECSDKFNHYIYELKRAKFGPISQFCSIWANSDERADFFQSKFDQKNKRNKKEAYRCADTDLTSGTRLFLPFMCQNCNFYYSEIKGAEKHRKCEKTNRKICFMCQIESLQKYQKIRKELPELPQKGEDEQRILCLKIPEAGLCLNTKYKTQASKYFKKIQKDNSTYLIQQKSEGNYEIISELKKASQESAFRRQNVIFQSEEINKSQSHITSNDVAKKLLLPLYLANCRKKKKTSITLSKEVLDDSLWQGVGVMPNMIKLNLAENDFTNIQAITQIFMNTETLILDSNKAIILPNQISYLRDLQELSLVNNLIETIGEGIGEMTKLRVLNLEKNKLEVLPEEIGKVAALEKLYLSKNRIKQLPDSFRNLINIKQLLISHNQIRKLPEQIFQKMKKLYKLQYDSNKLTNHPQIGHLTNLSHLTIGWPEMTSLPSDISSLNSIEQLSAEYTELSTLPDNLSKQNKYRVLLFSNNQIKSLPCTINKLSNLQVLFLNHNQLSTLPEQLCELENLQTLDLNFNQLTSLPKNIGKLTKLRILLLINNQLDEIPFCVGKLSSLENLSLTSNNLTHLPHSIGQLQNLERLQINHNKLTELPGTTEHLSNLEFLSITNNELKHLPPNICRLKQLKYFICSNNALTNIESEIGSMKNLRYLNIADNSIKQLPESLEDIDFIGFNFSNNPIQSVPEKLFPYLKQDFLNLNTINLAKIEEMLGPMPQIP